MRKKQVEQKRARELRAQGWSLREIADQLHVSHSSVSVWVRDIPITTERSSREPAESGPSDDAAVRIQLCGKCKQLLPVTDFNRDGTGYQWWCRECYRTYFRKRGDLHRQQSRAAKVRRQQIATKFLAERKEQGRCIDCGETDVRVLEFDHVGPKRNELSVLASGGASIALLEDELEHCELVCVNCHRRRTGRRDGWRRAAPQWWKTAPPAGMERARNMAFAYSYLERSSCVDCGLGDLCVLDFDHIDAKRGNVLELARYGVGLATLEAEIAGCEVRCANCHRRRHVDLGLAQPVA